MATAVLAACHASSGSASAISAASTARHCSTSVGHRGSRSRLCKCMQFKHAVRPGIMRGPMLACARYTLTGRCARGSRAWASKSSSGINASGAWIPCAPTTMSRSQSRASASARPLARSRRLMALAVDPKPCTAIRHEVRAAMAASGSACHSDSESRCGCNRSRSVGDSHQHSVADARAPVVRRESRIMRARSTPLGQVPSRSDRVRAVDVSHCNSASDRRSDTRRSPTNRVCSVMGSKGIPARQRSSRWGVSLVMGRRCAVTLVESQMRSTGIVV